MISVVFTNQVSPEPVPSGVGGSAVHSTGKAQKLVIYMYVVDGIFCLPKSKEVKTNLSSSFG